MFTGLIKTKGIIVNMKWISNGLRLCIVCNSKLNSEIGDSINCSGTCLTIVYINKMYIEFEMWNDTICSTDILLMKKFTIVNLEQPLTLGSKLHGHLVLGHVKSVARLIDMQLIGNSAELKIACPRWVLQNLKPYKSISLNGISLTIISISKIYFEVAIIKHTILNSSFRYLKINNTLCIE